MRTPRAGEVFVLPIDEGRVGVGQVVALYGDRAYFFAVFDAILSEGFAPSDVVEATARPLLLLALSMDAKLFVGDWRIVADAPVAPDIPLPAYKELVGAPARFEIVDYTGARRREATPSEVQSFPNRKVVAPVRLEKALRAHFGLEPWTEQFEELRPNNSPTSAEAFR